MPVERNAIVHCPHANECPGCPLIEKPYAEQLEVKRRTVADALAGYPELARSVVSEAVAGEPIEGYRTRAKLVVDGTRVGLFAGGTHRVVDLPECRVLSPEIAAAAAAIRKALPFDVPLRAVDLRSVEGSVFVTLVVPDGVDDGAVRRAVSRVEQVTPRVVGVAVARRDERSHQVLGRAPSLVWGASAARVSLRSGSPFHLVAPGTFAQAHGGQERALVSAIVERIGARAGAGGRPADVLDVFSGVGVLSLELASRGVRVHAVEAFEPSARLSREAAEAQSLPVTVEIGDAETVLRRLVAQGRRFDAVVVNPPRRGLAAALRSHLALLSPSLVVYVSCEPRSLARDLADLARRGFQVDGLVPYDMMPLSGEVETLATLTPGTPPTPVVIYADERVVAVSKPPHEPTTPQGEHEGSLADRVRRLEGAEQAVPVHRLDVGTSGVCLFARRPEFIPELSVALAHGEKEYVALVRGIVRDRGSVRRPLLERGSPKAARTRYVRREIRGGHSLVAVFPDQGYKHQIRRHLSSIGHPVVGDERYGHEATNQYFQARYFLDRPFLHCARITLEHGGRSLELKEPLASDLASVLGRLAASGSEDLGERTGPESE